MICKGVKPKFYFISGSGNKNYFSKKNLSKISKSLNKEQKKYDIRLCGGDTTFSNKLSFTIISMGYYNPILKIGIDNFFSGCKESGVNGVIIADIPNTELEIIQETSNKYNIETIPLVPLNASDRTVEHACKIGQGFIYCVSVLGVTGTREQLSKDLNKKVNQVSKFSDVPVAVGFGISKNSHIKELKNYADAAVIGSAIIDVISYSENNEIDNVVKFIKGLLK